MSCDGDADPLSSPKSKLPKASGKWQRMKWTDDGIRLLISTVASVDDDTPSHPAATALQKKGKWKAVSKAMVGRGCCVSPQQCEDKFNDLNKRYKKLTDILGAASFACQLVDNPHLLDSLPRVSPTAKDELRKILSSKHLFYREMHAYHGGGDGSQRTPPPHSPSPMLKPPHSHDLHSASTTPPPHPTATAPPDSHDDDECDYSDDYEDEESDDDYKGEEEDGGGGGEWNGITARSGIDEFKDELERVVGDPNKTMNEKREWIKRRAVELMEERVEIQADAYRIEEEWSRWMKFRSKKDRELEWLKLENDASVLENEQLVMQVRRQEVALDLKLLGGSSEPSGMEINVEQGKLQQIQ